MAVIKLPQPHEITEREREQAMAGYTMMFAGTVLGLPIPFISLLASYVYYYANKKTSNFVAFHSFQSLITQIPISIMNAIAVIWLVWSLFNQFQSSFFTFLIITGILNLLYFIFSLIGAIKGWKGKFYYFLFFGRITFNKFYGPKAQQRRKKESTNLPPKGY